MRSLYPEFFRQGRPNLDDDRWLLWSVAAFPIFFILVTLCVKVFTPVLYSYSIKEDGFIEWPTALAFVAAGMFAFLLAAGLWQGRRTLLVVLYAGLAAGMLLAALEEISWGQRVLDLDTPEFFIEHSTKEELNIHNLQRFPLGPVFILVGFYGAFSRLLMPGRVKRRFPFEVELLTPRYSLATYFLPTFLLYTYFEYFYYTVIRPMGITIRRDYVWGDEYFIVGKDQEAIELLLAFGFLILVLDNWQRHKARKAAAASALASAHRQT